MKHLPRLFRATLVFGWLSPIVVCAQGGTPDPRVNESVVTIPKNDGWFKVDLETTIFRPDGDGPFPVAVINHGKAEGNPRFQDRYRPMTAVRYFLLRGYAVVAPMRQGFSKSHGLYNSVGCNVESNGRVQAGDVRAALDFTIAQPWADKNRIVVLGQSHGGWTTLAFGAENYPGVKALVNFAGGLRQTDCPGWEWNLAAGAASYGRTTQMPSLWFYGDNDSYFNTHTYQAMHQRYTASGAKAKLIAFGTFGSDAHSLFGSRQGASIWQPEVSQFLASVGLPHEPDPRFSKFAEPAPTPRPAPTHFAPLSDETRVPWVRDEGRRGYKLFLEKPLPRAFAVGPGGNWGWSQGGDDPLQRALDHCNKNSRGQQDCKLYAVDDEVVWVPPPERHAP